MCVCCVWAMGICIVCNVNESTCFCDWFTFVRAISFVASHINSASSSSAVTNESVQVLSTDDIRKSLSFELIKFVQRMESELTVPNNLLKWGRKIYIFLFVVLVFTFFFFRFYSIDSNDRRSWCYMLTWCKRHRVNFGLMEHGERESKWAEWMEWIETRWWINECVI